MVRLAAVTIEQPRPAIVRRMKTENPGIAAGVFVSGGARSLWLTRLYPKFSVRREISENPLSFDLQSCRSVQMRKQFGAMLTAAMIEEAAEIYERRGIFRFRF